MVDTERLSLALADSGRLILGGVLAAAVFSAIIRWPGWLAFIWTLSIVFVLTGLVYWLDRESPDPPVVISEESEDDVKAWIREAVLDELDDSEIEDEAAPVSEKIKSSEEGD